MLRVRKLRRALAAGTEKVQEKIRAEFKKIQRKFSRSEKRTEREREDEGSSRKTKDQNESIKDQNRRIKNQAWADEEGALKKLLEEVREMEPALKKMKMTDQGEGSESENGGSESENEGSESENEETVQEKDKLKRERKKLGRWATSNIKRQKDAVQLEEARQRKLLAGRHERIIDASPYDRADAEEFRYAPLEYPRAQIRLLEVEVIEGDVICVASVHTLDASPAFVAVSYAWGDALDAKSIWINGKRHLVRRNCWSSLDQVARVQCPFFIWIDAVCINQDDCSEKSSQVQMMTTIFRRAAWVAAVPHNVLSPEKQRLGIEPEFPLHLASKADMFRRIWVVQEMLVAREVYLLLDERIRPFEDILQSTPDADADNHAVRLLRDRERDRVYRHRSNDPLAPLFHCLSKYSDFACMDPRDRIYALVPMSLCHLNVPPLEPNYQKSLLAVLHDFICYVRRLSQIREQSTLTFTDLMICLMKLTKLFYLTCDSLEVENFLSSRRVAEPFPRRTQISPESDKTPMAESFVFRQFESICLNGTNRHEATLIPRKAADLSDSAQKKIGDLGVALTLQDLTAICREGEPIFIGTKEILFADVLLTPTLAPLASTWIFAFRRQADQPDHYELIGQAIPVDKIQGLSLSTRGRCSCKDCPASRPRRTVMLHADDVLAMALLSREPVKRLMNAVTTPECGSFAILSESNRKRECCHNVLQQ